MFNPKAAKHQFKCTADLKFGVRIRSVSMELTLSKEEIDEQLALELHPNVWRKLPYKEKCIVVARKSAWTNFRKQNTYLKLDEVQVECIDPEPEAQPAAAPAEVPAE